MLMQVPTKAIVFDLELFVEHPLAHRFSLEYHRNWSLAINNSSLLVVFVVVIVIIHS